MHFCNTVDHKTEIAGSNMQSTVPVPCRKNYEPLARYPKRQRWTMNFTQTKGNMTNLLNAVYRHCSVECVGMAGDVYSDVWTKKTGIVIYI
jgi:hypothetical protein